MRSAISIICLIFSLNLISQNNYIDSLQILVEVEEDQILKADYLLDIAEEIMGFSLEGSLENARHALQISEEIKDNENIGRSLSWMGRVYGEMTQLDSALQVLEKAIEIFSSPVDSFYLTKSYNAIGIIYRYRGEMEKAIDYQFKSAVFAEEQGQLEVAASAYNSLGNIYSEIGDIPNAIPYYEKSLEMLSGVNRPRSITGAYLNLANMLSDDLDRKMALYKKAEALGLANNYQRELSYIYSGIANFYQEFDIKVDSQIFYYTLALKNAKASGDSYMQAYNMMYLGIASSGSNPQQSIVFLEKALEDEYIKSVPALKADGLYNLSKSYSSIGQHQNGYAVLDSALTYYKKRYDEEILNSSQEATAKFETDKKEAEIVKQQLQIVQQKQTRNKIIAGGVFLLLLSSGIGLWYFQRQSNRKKIAELALENEKIEKNKLQELDELKTQFFANVSHELKTPLTLIMGPLSNILEKVKNLEVKKNILLAFNNAEKLNDLINETLDLAKIEDGQIEVEIKQCQIAKDLRRCFQAFNSLAEMRNISLMDYVDISSNVVVNCDFWKIEKVLNNLISNAIKFSPNDAKIELRAFLIDQLLKIEVRDVGKGISEDEQDLIFNRFYQAKHNKFGSYGGSGIGLAYSKELTELMGGTLTVKSEVGVGSSFVVELPVDVLADLPKIETADENDIDTATSPPVYQALLIHGVKPSILVVEDNKDMQEYLGGILQENYYCDFAIDGYEAIRKVQTKNYHLISSDVMMPNMDGFTLKEKINHFDSYKNIPFIFLTARSLDEDKIEGLKLGVDDYITKPFNRNEYEIRILNLLENYKERLTANEEAENESTQSVDVQILKQAESIVLENIANSNFKVTDLADHLHYSQRQLSRIVKQLTGLTPVNFIIELRLQKAERLIKTKQFSSLSEVRYATGFESASYFTRKFRERFGINPSEL